MEIAGAPRAGTPVPRAVEALTRGHPIRPVWENELGGLTYEYEIGGGRRFVKWSPPGSGLDLAAEAERMTWLRPFSPVPVVVEVGGDDADPAGSWLVTEALDGESAVSIRWRADPAMAVRAIGAGLRRLHERAPLEQCPFGWSIDERVARMRTDPPSPARWKRDHRDLSLDEALARLADPPPLDGPVVCHGDACAPNTLVGEDGNWAGHVDLGRLGVADRWADLAIATWSTGWNYGPGWEQTLLDAYGIDPDPERTAYYRLLWDLSP